MDNEDKISVGLKVNRPFLKDSDGYSNLSGVYKIYGYFSLKNNWLISAEIPLVVAEWKDNEYRTNNTGLANLHIEVKKAFNANKTSYVAFGFFIPTPGDAKYRRMIIGFISDSYRYGHYKEGFTINGTIGYNLRNIPGAIFGVEIGPNLFIPTWEDGELELFIHYGVNGGYNFNKISVWAEFLNICSITEYGYEYSRFNQMLLVIQLNSGKFRPGISYGIFLNKDLRTNGILGLNFQFVFTN
jgi:hypothetical protein